MSDTENIMYGGMPIEEHARLVKEWVKENTEIIAEPDTITLSDFSIDWKTFSGKFQIAFDEKVDEDRWSFSLQGNGKTDFYLPEFCCPLGAPVSYPAIKITDMTKKAILKALQETIPPVTPAGLYVSVHLSPIRRISFGTLLDAQARVTEEYFITINVKDLSIQTINYPDKEENIPIHLAIISGIKKMFYYIWYLFFS